MRIRYPNGDTASDHVQALEPDRRIAFTYGYDAPGKPIAPGGSLVTITLADTPTGTRVDLRHDVADAATRDIHVQGWRHQLAVFARVVAEDAFSADAIAAWFAAWNAPAPRELLAAAVAGDVTFRDAYGCTRGLDELAEHVAASQRFMPGVRIEATGTPRHAHDVALADWTAIANGKPVMAGTHVFRLDADGRIADCIGIATRA